MLSWLTLQAMIRPAPRYASDLSELTGLILQGAIYLIFRC